MKPILVVGGRQSEFAPIYKKKRLAQNFRLRRLETYNDDILSLREPRRGERKSNPAFWCRFGDVSAPAVFLSQSRTFFLKVAFLLLFYDETRSL